jgi:hypothetical protein
MHLQLLLRVVPGQDEKQRAEVRLAMKEEQVAAMRDELEASIPPPHILYSHRNVQCCLDNKRVPALHATALAVLAVVTTTSLGCAHECGLTSRRAPRVPIGRLHRSSRCTPLAGPAAVSIQRVPTGAPCPEGMPTSCD